MGWGCAGIGTGRSQGSPGGSQELVIGSVPVTGTALGGSRCSCAGRVPLEARRAGSKGMRGAQSGVLAREQQRDS